MQQDLPDNFQGYSDVPVEADEEQAPLSSEESCGFQEKRADVKRQIGWIYVSRAFFDLYSELECRIQTSNFRENILN